MFPLILCVYVNMSYNSNRKRKPEYIPQEKYDVDGTLIKNEEAFRKKRWNLKEIVRVFIYQIVAFCS